MRRKRGVAPSSIRNLQRLQLQMGTSQYPTGPPQIYYVIKVVGSTSRTPRHPSDPPEISRKSSSSIPSKPDGEKEMEGSEGCGFKGGVNVSLIHFVVELNEVSDFEKWMKSFHYPPSSLIFLSLFLNFVSHSTFIFHGMASSIHMVTYKGWMPFELPPFFFIFKFKIMLPLFIFIFQFPFNKYNNLYLLKSFFFYNIS